MSDSSRAVAMAVAVVESAEARAEEAGELAGELAADAGMYLVEEAAVWVWMEGVVAAAGAVTAAAAAAARWIGGSLRPRRRSQLAQIIPQ